MPNCIKNGSTWNNGLDTFGGLSRCAGPVQGPCSRVGQFVAQEKPLRPERGLQADLEEGGEDQECSLSCKRT